MVLDPKTGSVLALVGGRDYRRSQFNRAVQARRQPGSLFKPFVYLAALEAARESQVGQLTAASLLSDEPVTFESETGSWSPQNYDKQFHGPVTVRSALEQSFNVPAVRAAKMLGAKPIVQLLHRLGVTSVIGDDLSSVALGSSSVSLMEITSAYGAVANGGIAVRPTAVRSIRDRQGDMVWNGVQDRHRLHRLKRPRCRPPFLKASSSEARREKPTFWDFKVQWPEKPAPPMGIVTHGLSAIRLTW